MLKICIFDNTSYTHFRATSSTGKKTDVSDKIQRASNKRGTLRNTIAKSKWNSKICSNNPQIHFPALPAPVGSGPWTSCLHGGAPLPGRRLWALEPGWGWAACQAEPRLQWAQQHGVWAAPSRGVPPSGVLMLYPRPQKAAYPTFPPILQMGTPRSRGVGAGEESSARTWNLPLLVQGLRSASSQRALKIPGA